MRRARQASTPVPDRRARRERWASVLALGTAIGLGCVIGFGESPRFLMPGPLTSSHAAIGTCTSCHTQSGSGPFRWLKGLVSGEPLADSKACLTCHGMPDTALKAHGAPETMLSASRKRSAEIAGRHNPPFSATAQSKAFPVESRVDRGLFCATCHQEHQGAAFRLAEISNEQCNTCHQVKFESFDGHHPEFNGYPFRRRSRIIYDHAGHFGKHFPELASKGLSERIPATCSTCHDSAADRRLMAVAPFERTCAACHQDQILGYERVSGPKGVAVLTLPGLDLQTLRKRKAVIGEWPEASEAALTPFMKVLIGRTVRGSTLVETVGVLDLQDLSRASDEQVKAVAELAWEIKQLFHRLMTGKASDLLADPEDGGAKLTPALISDLTANLPRDVIVGAQRQWLPNLVSEMAGRRSGAAASTSTDPAPSRPPSPAADPAPAPGSAKTAAAPSDKRDRAGAQAGGKTMTAPATAEPQPQARTGTQNDDLLNPTEDERRAMAAVGKSRSTSPVNPSGDTAGTSAPAANSDANPIRRAPVAPAATARVAPEKLIEASRSPTEMEVDVDPETWADVGGWYRQEHAILYRPVGHKDKFMTAWLKITGSAAEKGSSPAAAAFAAMTDKDAQGSCAKCHSIDQQGDKGQRINFAPLGVETKKKGRLTAFIHEPHVALAPRGCVTCHVIEKGAPYLESYKYGDPSKSASNFAAVKKEVCTTCHMSGATRQDCLTCHKYHVDGAVSPDPETKLTLD